MAKPEKGNKKDLGQPLADCEVAIVKALQPPTAPSNAVTVACAQPQIATRGLPVGISSGKKVNLRSQYLSQLKKLQNLQDDGVLTEDEFQAENFIVLDTLKTLK